MSETPPGFANYPRNAPTYGTSAQLRNLADGYFGLNKIFLVNIALALGSRLVGLVTTRENAIPAILGYALVVGLLIGFLTYPCNRKIGDAAGWWPAQAVIASIAMGINSALCCGIIGYIVMQQIASNHLKRYGLKSGFFGIKKATVELAIRNLEAQEAHGPLYQ